MNIILATDAVTPPLTGIGRYTWELGTRLPALVAPDTLRFISRGRWVDTLATQLTPAPARAAIRRSVLRSRLAAMAYALIWPVVMRQRLRRVPDSLYHGTNSSGLARGIYAAGDTGQPQARGFFNYRF